MAESDELLVVREPDESAEPAPRDVLEEDALDRILGAEAQDLLARGVDELRLHSPDNSRGARRRFLVLRTWPNP